ncbi:MAG: hypothetical protein ACLU4N_03500 [Butyricimonas faecihominis]
MEEKVRDLRAENDKLKNPLINTGSRSGNEKQVAKYTKTLVKERKTWKSRRNVCWLVPA